MSMPLSRIDKINALYARQKQQRAHRDSVVSNSTTSVIRPEEWSKKDESRRDDQEVTPVLKPRYALIQSRTKSRNEKRGLGEPLPLRYLSRQEQNETAPRSSNTDRWNKLLQQKQHTNHLRQAQLSQIHEEIQATQAKLDEIISLLRQKDTSSYTGHYEYLIWTAAILVLIACNIYVYYYL